ncbi:MAG: acetyl-CoA carboxylase biotin carboxyl carrier protein subunit [Terriglobales bacterium]
MTYEVEIAGQSRKLEITPGNPGWRIRCNGAGLEADIARPNPGTLSVLIAGRSFSFDWARGADGAIWLSGSGRTAAAAVRDPRQALARHRFEHSGRARLTAPMAGKVVRVLVSAGAAVEAGQGLLVLEAMKMQNEVRSPKSGTLTSLAVAAGETVATGQVLAEVE